jgi:hypothetical protein
VTENFSSIVIADFEYEIMSGGLPDVLCMVAYVLDENLRHVRTIRLWRDEFSSIPPFDIGSDTLFVAYSAWAEMTCFLVLGWQFPTHIYDLHTAYLAASNILLPPTRTSFTKSRASDCPTPAALTASKVGSASIRRRLLRTSAKVVGEIMVRPLSTTIARKTCACR